VSEVSKDEVISGVVLALDLGERRIGVAVSDRRRILASPLTILVRSGDRRLDHEAIRRLVEESNATLVVVGLPLSLSGKSGPAATRALEEIAQLGEELDVPVVAQDERLSSVEANRRLREDQVARSKTRAPTKKRRAVLDDKAAAIVLEAYLLGAGQR
jgi:putative Holliday junction resolvase